VRFSAKVFVIVLQDSEVLGWLPVTALIPYCSFAICSNSCMSGGLEEVLVCSQHR
jgi:hypothetical protein